MNINQYPEERFIINLSDYYDIDSYDDGTGVYTTAKISGQSIISNIKRLFGFYSQIADSNPVTGTTAISSIHNAVGQGTLTVPAKTFEVGDSFNATLSGEFSCSNNETCVFYVRTLGGVVLATSGVITLSSATNATWELEIDFTIRSTGVAGAIATTANFVYNQNQGNTWNGQGWSFVNNTFNTNIDHTLEIAIEWGSANVANSIWSRIFILRRTF